VNQTEKVIDAVMAVLTDEELITVRAEQRIRKRVTSAIEAVLSPPAPLAAILAETEKALDNGQLYTTHDVAKMFQVDASTVSKWIDSKKLIAFRTPGGHRRVRARDLQAFTKKYDMPITGEFAA
jgi:excisionase family DNA binding protein